MTRQASSKFLRRTAGIAALTMMLSVSAQASTFNMSRFEFGFGSFFSSIFDQFDSLFARFGSGTVQLPPGLTGSGTVQLPPGVNGSGTVQLPPGIVTGSGTVQLPPGAK